MNYYFYTLLRRRVPQRAHAHCPAQPGPETAVFGG
jgi:hypothetical protein